MGHTTMRGGRPYLQRRLAAEMIRERNTAGLNAKQAAEAAGVAQSSLSRLENAESGVHSTTFRALLDYAYKVPPGDRRDYLLGLYKLARSGTAYWSTYGDVFSAVPWFETYVDLELEADAVLAWDPWLINGLMQTEAYARALISMGNPSLPDSEVTRMVELRIERQKRVLDGQLAFDTVIAEEVLARPYGGAEAFKDQLRHMARIAALPRVTVQILPAGGTPPPHAGQFHIVDFRDAADPAVVYLEELDAATYHRDAQRVRKYAQTHRDLRGAAHSPNRSEEIIAQLLKG